MRLISDAEANIPMTVDGYQIDEPRYKINEFTLAQEFPKILTTVMCVWRDSQDAPHSAYYDEDSLILINRIGPNQEK